jgi:hypothetical protein
MSDNAIFNLRFGSNAKIAPSAEELQRFLDSRKQGSPERQGDDLASYWDLLTAVAEYRTGRGPESFQDKMLYAVLSHSHFAKPALRSAVEQFKYHFNTLSNLDFKKPTSFIKSAEEEIARIEKAVKNNLRKEEATRIERLRMMIEERKKTLDAEKKRWLELAEEMSHILAYVAENLGRIGTVCEQSIVILVNEQLDRKKEVFLIESIKTQFKERLKESLHRGTIKKEDLEHAKEEVAALSTRMEELVRSDIFTLTQVYESIHGHVKSILGDLVTVLETIKGKKHTRYEEDLELYRGAEKMLVALVTGCRFAVKSVEIGAETGHADLLTEKRREILDHLLALLEKGS